MGLPRNSAAILTRSTLARAQASEGVAISTRLAYGQSSAVSQPVLRFDQHYIDS